LLARVFIGKYVRTALHLRRTQIFKDFMISSPSKPVATPNSRAVLTLLGTAVLLLVVMIFAISNGTLEITPGLTLNAIWKGVSGQKLEGLEIIVWSLRLPRVVFGALVGASLAACGAAFQGLFRNPLADPYLMGSASGAALGATIAVFITGTVSQGFAAGLFSSSSQLVPTLAFVGALGAVMLTLTLSKFARGGNALILSGVIVGGILTSVSTYIQLRDADRMRAVFSWTLGNLSLAGWNEVLNVVPYTLFGIAALMLLARALDALQLGEDTASTLGLRVDRVVLLTVIAASLVTAAAVAFAGIIGFIGLVAPHAMRRLGVASHRVLIPASSLAGASLLVVADLGARVLTRPQELPVGVVTTVVGGIFFLALMRRNS
jgi:iron complex transport system permease protein